MQTARALVVAAVDLSQSAVGFVLGACLRATRGAGADAVREHRDTRCAWCRLSVLDGAGEREGEEGAQAGVNGDDLCVLYITDDIDCDLLRLAHEPLEHLRFSGRKTGRGDHNAAVPRAA